MPDDLDLDALKALIPTVYRDPWHVEYDEPTGQWLVRYRTDNPLAGLVATVPDYGEWLAAFIAAARTAVPALIAEVERLRGVIDRINAFKALVVMQRDQAEVERDRRGDELRRAQAVIDAAKAWRASRIGSWRPADHALAAAGDALEAPVPP